MNISEKLSLSQFLWYVLPGVALVLSVLLPVAVFFPSAVTSIGSLGGLALVSALGLVAGYTMDGLRLYRLRPGYRRRRKQFMEAVCKEAGGRFDPYYVLMLAQDLARGQGRSGFDFTHASWIMLSHLGMCLLANGAVWLIFALAHWRSTNAVVSVLGAISISTHIVILCDILGAAFALSAALRLIWVSHETQERANSFYLQFIKDNSEILFGGRLAERSVGDSKS